MKAVIQRVSHSSVKINNIIKSEINSGLLILIGFVNDDENSDIEWLCNKILNLRIFNDCNGIMNLSVNDINGEILIVSQFTLHASTKKGNRPSYIEAAKPEKAIHLYNEFIAYMQTIFNKQVKTGEFGADMKVELINDGPVTIIIDTKNKI
jgi:D-aminoacyl-tRNA deacylase